MRKLIPTVFPLLIIVVPAGAQEPVAKADKAPWANKFFVGPIDNPPPNFVYDFGVLKKGTVKEYRFEMTNIYAVPMEIREPIPSSGSLSIKDYSAKLRPKEAGHILVKIDTSKFDGRKVIRLPVMFHGTDAKTKEVFFSTAELEVWVISK